MCIKHNVLHFRTVRKGAIQIMNFVTIWNDRPFFNDYGQDDFSYTCRAVQNTCYTIVGFNSVKWLLKTFNYYKN